jgi:hypothetical protein
MSFRALRHLQITESTTTGFACPPVPPSGFGYPLDGFLLGDPCQPCFRSAAPLGFTLRSFLLTTGTSAFLPGLTHVPLATRPSARPKANGKATSIGFWALLPSRVPCGLAGPLSPVAAGGSLGFRPSRGF